MKKILFVASDNNKISGAFRSMVKLCELINASGRYRTLVILPCRGEGDELLNEAKIEYRHIPSYSWIVSHSETNRIKNVAYKFIKKLINRVAVMRISSVIRSKKIALVHTNTSYAYVGHLAAVKTKKRSVWHIRELLEEDQNCSFWDKDAIRLLQRADVCVAISQCVRDKYASKLCNIRVIYNGIDPSIYYYERDFSVTNDVVNFLCIGNMSGKKGQDVVLVAAKLLIERGIGGFKVRFVGSGTYEDTYKKMAADYGLGSNVEFCGRTNRASDYYNSSDVLLMASSMEAFGRTTIEAMMAGCLIIGSDSGATPELIRNDTYGLLFEKEDPESLAQCMQCVIEDRSVFGLAEKGQKFALETFSAQKNANQVISLYDKLLGSEKNEGNHNRSAVRK